MSPEMFLNSWNQHLIFVSNLTSTNTKDEHIKMIRYRNDDWNCSSTRNRYKNSRTISSRQSPSNDCTTIMSLVISVYFVSLLFCYGVTDGRPQTQQQQLNALSHKDYFDRDFTAEANGEHLASLSHSPEDEAESNQVTNPRLTPDLLKLREIMLMELGLTEAAKNASYTIPHMEISREEYIRAYTEYMTKVRSRRLAEKEAIDSLTQRERRKKFRKTVQFFDNLNRETNLTTFDSDKETVFKRQLMFDINFARYYDTPEVRIREATLSLPTGCYLPHENNIDDQYNRVNQLDITNNVTYWINHARNSADHHAFTLTAECLSSRIEATENSNGYIKVIAKLASKEELRNRRSKRSVAHKKFLGVRDLLNRGRAKDCSETRHGKTCCRKPLRVDFEELGVKDFIFEPKAFDAYMCSGRCNAKRVAYASTHAMIQQTLHKSFGKDRIQKPCCAPMELGALDVIHTVPGEHRLEVTTIHDAIVLRCGCS